MNKRQFQPVDAGPVGLHRHSRGFTLIEVLITIVVMSFGLLGLAGLQLTSLKNSRGAALRTTAMQHAYDMADRMRANLAAVGTGAYDMSTVSAGTNTATCLTITGCTPAQMAAHDIYEWQLALSASTNASGNGLPAGAGIVCIDSSAESTASPSTPSAPACDNLGQLYRIKVWYADETPAPGNPIVYKAIVVDFQV